MVAAAKALFLTILHHVSGPNLMCSTCRRLSSVLWLQIIQGVLGNNMRIPEKKSLQFLIIYLPPSLVFNFGLSPPGVAPGLCTVAPP